MSYPAIEGEIFSGRESWLWIVIRSALDFFSALSDVERGMSSEDQALLPSIRYRSSDLRAGAEALIDLTKGSPQLSDATREVLRTDLSWIEELAMTQTPPNARLRLVHGDLNHANVLIHQDGPRFIDLEDIRLEDAEIAMAHAVFKLTRHSVYVGELTRGDVRMRVLPSLLHLLGERGYAISEQPRFLSCAAARILRDIHLISSSAAAGGTALLYDFEKRVHNLLELRDLVGLNSGP